MPPRLLIKATVIASTTFMLTSPARRRIPTPYPREQLLDVYCWLAYRLHSLPGPTKITWKALHAQFGKGSPLLAQFKYYFKTILDLATAVYPDAKVGRDDTGVILYPSRPPISPRIAPAIRHLKA